ncbi:MAG: isocitrate/isopropylmalate dehydrogenase family protein, partial [Chloroflexi bacterium]|nr:isocitrate/isopropylmalate dehydrogenase family protein [Chloroflexota bacterium]
QTFQERGTALPEETLDAARRADATLFGAVSSPLQPVPGYRSPIVALRRALDLYANLRPVISQPVPGARPGIDLLIVRENTEDLYAGRERATEEEAVTERVITRRASERIARLAFRLARERRGHVTIVHKANVLRATCGLFREVAFAVAREFPDVRAEEMLVDTAAMRLVTHPEAFDVIVTTNLFGDILSDEAAALVGGLGLAPSANVNERQGLFEPVHGSAPDIAGRGIANPMATFGAVAMLLDHLGERRVADRVRRAMRIVLEEGNLTPDLGGTATTAEITERVLRAFAGLA